MINKAHLKDKRAVCSYGVFEHALNALKYRVMYRHSFKVNWRISLAVDLQRFTLPKYVNKD